MGTRKDSKGRVLHKGESQREKYYIYQYTDVNHKRRVVYAKDLPELRIKEKEIIRDMEDGLDVSKRAAMTLNEAFDAYFQGRTDLKHSSRLSYGYLYNHYVRPEFGNRKVAKIVYSDVRAFYLSLLHDQKLSKKTLSTIHSVLYQVFNVAVRDSILRINPADGVMTELLRRNRLQEEKRHALTYEQQMAFMKHAVEQPEFEQWLPLLYVLLGTGCRIGEVLGLRWDDVDFENKNIHITHSLLYQTLDTGKVGFYISTPKTEAGNRVIPMMSQVEQELLLVKKEQQLSAGREKGMQKPKVDGYTDFIFTSDKYKYGLYTPAVVNRAIKDIVESYNKKQVELADHSGRKPELLPYITCHHLRHTFCSRFCENETNLKVIQSIMGHASITTTMNRYAEATEAKKKECITNLENKIMIM